MKRRHLLAALALPTLAACSKSEPAAPVAPAAPEAQKAYADAQAGGTGFSVGPLMGADPVLVFFDPQCPHCGELWKASQPLLGKLRMVWMPVGILRPTSAPQGVLILAAKDPAATMSEHEVLLENRQGGLPVPEQVDATLLAKVKANTELFSRLGADSVPFILYRNRQTGAYASHAGALPTEQIAARVGL